MFKRKRWSYLEARKAPGHQRLEIAEDQQAIVRANGVFIGWHFEFKHSHDRGLGDGFRPPIIEASLAASVLP